MVSIEILGMNGVIAKTNHIKMPVTEKTTGVDALDYIISKYPDITIHKDAVIVAVNHEVVPMDKLLQANDTISFLPPIGGG